MHDQVRNSPGVQPVGHDPIEEAVSSVVVGEPVEDPFERGSDDIQLGVGEHADEVPPDGGDVCGSGGDDGRGVPLRFPVKLAC
ncbi:hypothetical protein [Nonomuraea sp. NPDC049158]|uniref:hypothetical protein n=1 Tax=Nonomuraea sp. NPDC049158 TaxID=3155649 RepID=UPI0033F5FFEB